MPELSIVILEIPVLDQCELSSTAPSSPNQKNTPSSSACLRWALPFSAAIGKRDNSNPPLSARDLRPALLAFCLNRPRFSNKQLRFGIFPKRSFFSAVHRLEEKSHCDFQRLSKDCASAAALPWSGFSRSKLLPRSVTMRVLNPTQ